MESDEMEVTREIPRALMEQSCCIGLIGKNVVVDCETRAEAEEVLDWLCDGRTAQATALAAKEAENAELRAKVERLREALETAANALAWAERRMACKAYAEVIANDERNARATLAETQP